MVEQTNTIAIQTKRYAMQLLKTYELLNVLPSKQRIGAFVYIFERSDELIADLDRLAKEFHENKERPYLFTDKQVKILMGLLEGYDIEDSDRMDLLHKFGKNVDMTDIQEETELNLDEVVTEEQVEKLKQIMGSGDKNFSKYNQAYNKIVKKK